MILRFSLKFLTLLSSSAKQIVLLVLMIMQLGTMGTFVLIVKLDTNLKAYFVSQFAQMVSNLAMKLVMMGQTTMKVALKDAKESILYTLALLGLRLQRLFAIRNVGTAK